MKLLINENRINWEDKDSHYFFNPHHPRASDFKKLATQIPVLKAHIYLYTSSGSKVCLLSKKALLSSARLANKNLQATSKDKWLISLPIFHVSGLSIIARAFLSGSAYSFQKGSWNPMSFQKQIEKEKITLSSLVPTQVYDLVQHNLKAPTSLRALLVGGAFLSSDLYHCARDLAWPLLPCYGATETSSHIASADINSLKKKSIPEMNLLDAVELTPVERQGFFKVKTPGLLTAYFDWKSQKLYDPKDNKGRFLLEDRLSFEKRMLKVYTPPEDQMKVLGEKINLKLLRLKLKRHLEAEDIKAYLIPLPHERRGWNLVLMGEIKDFKKLFFVRNQFNKQVSAYERIQSLYLLEEAPQSQFLKLKRSLLLEKIGFTGKKLSQ